jgi:hypothetical protein
VVGSGALDYFSTPKPFPPLMTPDGGIAVPEFGKIIKYIPLSDPQNRVLYATGDPVMEYGMEGEPVGATWTEFGLPMVDQTGQVAFRGAWRKQTNTGSGIFVDGRLIAKVGGPAPHDERFISQRAATAFRFASMMDPVITENGGFAFRATLAGPGITTESESAVVYGGMQTGEYRAALLLREGWLAPNLATWAGFRTISIHDTTKTGDDQFELVCEGSLRNGPGTSSVTTSDDSIVFGSTAMSNEVLVREGNKVSGARPDETIRKWSLLTFPERAQGHGRSFGPNNEPTFTAVLSSGRKALLRSRDGETRAFVLTGDSLNSAKLPGATWISFGSVAATVDSLALLGKARSNSGEQLTGVFEGNAVGTMWEPVALVGGDAPGVSGGKFKSFRPPVSSPRIAGGPSKVAFLATVSGGAAGANVESLWLAADRGEPALVAEELAPAVDCPGYVWSELRSIALPGGEGGPLLLAVIKSANAKGAAQLGLWAVDSKGLLRVLFREGTVIEGRKLRGFSVLSASRGSPGLTRAFNNYSDVVWLARFSGGVQAIVRITIPDARW